MNCPINTTSAQKRLIGCVDDDIDVKPRDVTANNFDAFRSNLRHGVLLI
jgi:hypothetical protein